MPIENRKLVRIIAFDSEGNDFPVSLSVKTWRRRSAPYSKWALINLEGPTTELIRTLNQTQSRILLALIFAAKPLRLKDLAAIVGVPTSQACREAKPLLERGLVEKVEGRYQASTLVRWTGRWEPLLTSRRKPLPAEGF
jgi:hypothetical protein